LPWVKSVFAKQVERAQIQAPVTTGYEPPMPDFANEDYGDYVEFNSTPKENKSAKASMAKMISQALVAHILW
jgi:hypothetical protein